MKKLVLVGLFASALSPIVADLPEGWYTQFQRLVNASNQMDAMLVSDQKYYQGVIKGVNEIKPVFVAMNVERDEILSCIRSRFNQMKTDLAKCKTDTEAYIIDAKEEIVYLKAELEALKERTSKEIADLTNQKNTLEIQIVDLQTEIDTDTGEFKEGASALLEELRETVTQYNKTIDGIIQA